MTRLVQVGAELQRFLDARSWPNCIIGGLAVQRWGEPRLTVDVDLTLLTGFGSEEQYIDTVLERYQSRIESPRDFALARRVLLVRSNEGIGIDIALGGLPFEENVMRRASDFEFAGGASLRTCSAEDLVVMKAIAGREQDWIDIQGVLARQGTRLQWQTILAELEPLCQLKEAPDIVPRLERVRQGLERE